MKSWNEWPCLCDRDRMFAKKIISGRNKCTDAVEDMTGKNAEKFLKGAKISDLNLLKDFHIVDAAYQSEVDSFVQEAIRRETSEILKSKAGC